MTVIMAWFSRLRRAEKYGAPKLAPGHVYTLCTWNKMFAWHQYLGFYQWHQCGYPNSWLVDGKSTSKMDAFLGYPHFRKPHMLLMKRRAMGVGTMVPKSVET